MIYLILLALLGGCAGQPETIYWQTFKGRDKFYTWYCQYEPSKKLYTPAFGEHFKAQCFRSLHLRP